MTKTLILYSTVDGQTLAICQKMQMVMQDAGEQVELLNLSEASVESLTQADRILIGASIRYGKHRPELFSFVNSHQALLRSKVNGFFSVNVVARKPEKNTPATNPYMIKFLQLSAWQPQILEVFGGKIAYPKYGPFDRFMIRFIMWMTKGPTDTKGTFDFTDWNKVDEFAKHFMNQQ
ncbi:menaquinone-dependent protoporphyrinogen IX dehydrogenase [Shewanella sp. SR44-3]|uniref:menaquinone-dependent protoporphyrinogen IX dehydrogenase n=1 Tax=Shewanella sp. SR44-3 TaxID=2760936 RepID=UPI0015FD594E|nr:menaquinone-dependent protoporphyrinogen IX dehydrogenase [Shewanella sp. SR44-3]MBB1269746.1 menaquinone-dependent protoporphyrinogen IX dehydrogenase [Shewanella sp. SR44-3]